MKVSIITIAWNSQDTIRDTIESVLMQDYQDIEYIIVDGASTDNTMKIVNEYGERIHCKVSEPDKGIYDAMNKGIDLATGDLIGILNSDDLYMDAKVVSDVVNSLGDADAVYADLVYVNREDPQKVTRSWKSGIYKPGAFRKGWMPPHPTFFVRKQAYTNFGLYSTDLKISSDYELMLRFIHRHQITLAYLPRVIIRMRVGGASNMTIKHRLNANREDNLAWRMNGLKPAPFLSLRKPLSKVGQFLKRNSNN